jgi:hypothetical protein
VTLLLLEALEVTEGLEDLENVEVAGVPERDL